MSLPAKGWKNKGGTSKRGENPSMKSLWIKKGFPWPDKCSVAGCDECATDGAHMINSSSESMEEWIVPTCHYHNEQENGYIQLKGGVKLHKLKDLKSDS